MSKNIVSFTITILALLFFTVSNAQQDDNAFEDEYGNKYKESVGATLYENTDDGGNTTFASEDDPGSDEEGGGSVEDPPAPINGYLIYLVIAGIGLGGLYYKNYSD